MQVEIPIESVIRFLGANEFKSDLNLFTITTNSSSNIVSGININTYNTVSLQEALNMLKRHYNHQVVYIDGEFYVVDSIDRAVEIVKNKQSVNSTYKTGGQIVESNLYGNILELKYISYPRSDPSGRFVITGIPNTQIYYIHMAE